MKISQKVKSPKKQDKINTLSLTTELLRNSYVSNTQVNQYKLHIPFYRFPDGDFYQSGLDKYEYVDFWKDE